MPISCRKCGGPHLTLQCKKHAASIPPEIEAEKASPLGLRSLPSTAASPSSDFPSLSSSPFPPLNTEAKGSVPVSAAWSSGKAAKQDKQEDSKVKTTGSKKRRGLTMGKVELNAPKNASSQPSPQLPAAGTTPKVHMKGDSAEAHEERPEEKDFEVVVVEEVEEVVVVEYIEEEEQEVLMETDLVEEVPEEEDVVLSLNRLSYRQGHDRGSKT